MVKYPAKSSRRIKYRYAVEIDEGIRDILDNECYDCDFYEDEIIIDNSETIQNKIYSFDDFMKTGLFTEQPLKTRRKKLEIYQIVSKKIEEQP